MERLWLHRLPRAVRCATLQGVPGDPWTMQLDALGELLRAHRLAAGLSPRDLAERTQVPNAYPSQLERGLHEPSLRVYRSFGPPAGRR